MTTSNISLWKVWQILLWGGDWGNLLTTTFLTNTPANHIVSNIFSSQHTHAHHVFVGIKTIERLGGGFRYFYFHPEPWGNDPIWRAYFSDGLVQPPSKLQKLIKHDRTRSWSIEWSYSPKNHQGPSYRGGEGTCIAGGEGTCIAGVFWGPQNINFFRGQDIFWGKQLIGRAFLFSFRKLRRYKSC